MSTMTTAQPFTGRVTGPSAGHHEQDGDEHAARRAERLREQRERLQHRHSQALTRLMDTRRDLRGVHALADFVDESVRWSA